MGAIKCYGDFWNREKVNWTPGPSGRALWGRGRKSTSNKIDFRYQAGVYVLFTPQREIVYVGQAGAGDETTLYGRLRRHNFNRLRDRWTHFSWFGVLSVTEDFTLAEFEPQLVEKRSVLDELEGILIHLVEPRLNRQGAQWGGAIDYLQRIKEDPPDADDEAA